MRVDLIALLCALLCMKRKIGKGKRNSHGAIRIGEVLPQIFARYGMHRQLDHDELIHAWSEVVAAYLPDSLKNASEPGGVKRGTLEVRAKHAAIVQELLFHEKEILQTLSQMIPARKIKRIRFLVEG